MAIQYYRRLPPRPIECVRGGAHTSDFGFYVSNTYSFHDRTFDAPSSSVWGAELSGYCGGFGYFLQDANGDGEQRARRLSTYLSLHDITSSVDTDVAGDRGFTKVCREIDAGHPVVLLAGLAPAGHYLTCIGYLTDQHALVCHDPAGDRTLGYPNWRGAAVVYDWPGWNNGRQNLTAVPRIIYAQAEPPVSAPRSRFVNVSARAQCGSDSAAVIVGFVIDGADPRAVLIRAVGPTLQSMGVSTGVVQDPVVEIHKAGGTGSPIATNDNWTAGATTPSVQAATIQTGAMPLDVGDTSSAAVVLTLSPGAYTVVARDKTGAGGIVLVEAYAVE